MVSIPFQEDVLVKGYKNKGGMFWKYQLSQHLDKVWAGHSLNSEGCRHLTGVVK